jgi:hypothetical protein
MVFFTVKRMKDGDFKGSNVLPEIGIIRNKSTSLIFFFKGLIKYGEEHL